MNQAAEITLPCRGGDWVMNGAGRVAKVKRCYFDHHAGEVLVDLVMYEWSGNCTGRESPIEGGPRTYEPCCSYENWHRIEAPDFPMTPQWVPDGNGRAVSRYYSEPRPDGKYKERKPRIFKMPAIKPSNAPGKDINTVLRMAADQMREVARSLDGDSKKAVLEKAKELEERAAQ